MNTITDFSFKVLNICPQLNRIRRQYDIIGHLEYTWMFSHVNDNQINQLSRHIRLSFK